MRIPLMSKGKGRRMLAAIAASSMLLCLIPAGANAAETTVADEGQASAASGSLMVAAQEFRLKNEKSANNAKIYWSRVSGATSFTVYRIEGSTRTQIGTTTGHTWDDYGLKVGAKYTYEVKASPSNATATSNVVTPFTPTNITRSMSNIKGSQPGSDEPADIPDGISSVNSQGRPAWFTSPNCPTNARPYKTKYMWVNATDKATGKPYVVLQHKTWWVYNWVHNGQNLTRRCYDSQWTNTMTTSGKVWRVDNAIYNVGNHNVVNPVTHNSIAASHIIPNKGSSAINGTAILEMDSVEPVIISSKIKSFPVYDVTLFADGNNAYLLGAANNQQDTGILKLNSRWTDADSSTKPLYVARGEQGEAPYIFKKDGIYYLLTSRSAMQNPSQAKYQWSKSMMSGWSATTEIGDASTFDTQQVSVRTDTGSVRTTYTSRGIHFGAAAYRTPHTPIGTVQREFPIAVNGTYIAYGWYEGVDVDSQYGAVPVQTAKLVSLGRTATDSAKKTVNVLTDGDMANSDGYAEETKPPYSVTVDLGGPVAVSEIDFTTRLNVYNQATFNYKIEYSLDGNSYRTYKSEGNNPYIGFIPNVLPSTASARYVRITVTGIKQNYKATSRKEPIYQGLHEISVYGTRTGPVVTTYTVAFNSNGGSAVAAQSVNSGAKVKQPANPTRAGYTFAGWYYGNAKWDFNRAVTGNITLTAQWTKNAVPVTYRTVAFNSNGGSAVASQKVANGQKATQPANPTRAGYTFAGWYNGKTKYDFNKPVTANLTLTAQWTKNAVPVTYRTVAFNSNGGSAVASQKVANGAKVAQPKNPTRSGYTFAGWYYGNAKWDFNRGVTANITLTAKWTKNAEPSKPSVKQVPVYRVYNRNSGLHHYTINKAENDMLVRLGWRDENRGGSAFVTVSKDTPGAKPVYREYNRRSGNHNWTLNKKEHDMLVRLGWKDEGIAWYTSPTGRDVYRLYNPKPYHKPKNGRGNGGGEHVYTTSYAEYRAVVAAGWRGEGVAWKSL
ncbi:InlB B-repeat-containing protein [Bifidobacterium simiarum]|uniref:InlB B-repeat-containing protein n=1 Tax=Bifidobacterium simiarum TaxID=2045441 RepID=UPI001BDD0D44|nr:InlB B-repeat-containing protein [Bifidobacterium simiarum]MBT1167165.1 InlB B-repeat-containing protein [Bifidobacterium simiarum]